MAGHNNTGWIDHTFLRRRIRKTQWSINTCHVQDIFDDNEAFGEYCVWADKGYTSVGNLVGAFQRQPPGALTQEEKTVNSSMLIPRVSVEHSFSLVSNVFAWFQVHFRLRTGGMAITQAYNAAIFFTNIRSCLGYTNQVLFTSSIIGRVLVAWLEIQPVLTDSLINQCHFTFLWFYVMQNNEQRKKSKMIPRGEWGCHCSLGRWARIFVIISFIPLIMFENRATWASLCFIWASLCIWIIFSCDARLILCRSVSLLWRSCSCFNRASWRSCSCAIAWWAVNLEISMAFSRFKAASLTSRRVSRSWSSALKARSSLRSSLSLARSSICNIWMNDENDKVKMLANEHSKLKIGQLVMLIHQCVSWCRWWLL